MFCNKVSLATRPVLLQQCRNKDLLPPVFLDIVSTPIVKPYILCITPDTTALDTVLDPAGFSLELPFAGDHLMPRFSKVVITSGATAQTVIGIRIIPDMHTTILVILETAFIDLSFHIQIVNRVFPPDLFHC
jgi:hypothetical protein